MAKAKEPMIGKESRPSALDYETSISELRVKDLVGLIRAEIEVIKPELSKPEWHKPEGYKPEQIKPENYKPEWIKPEQIKPEYIKPEQLKPERFKPEQLKPELSKPEKEFEIPAEQLNVLVDRVIDVLRERKVIK